MFAESKPSVPRFSTRFPSIHCSCWKIGLSSGSRGRPPWRPILTCGVRYFIPMGHSMRRTETCAKLQEEWFLHVFQTLPFVPIGFDQDWSSHAPSIPSESAVPDGLSSFLRRFCHACIQEKRVQTAGMLIRLYCKGDETMDGRYRAPV